jgi:long-chain fatty acid transport protein
MKKSWLVIFLFTFVFESLYAGGFQVNLQSVRQTGMAHTGTGMLNDNSLVFFNPGGVSLLDSVQGINVGGSFIFPNVEFNDPGGNYSAQPERHIGTPFHVYANFRFKKFSALHFGLGVYTPFGSRLQWADDWKGKFLIQEINLKTIFIQPTLSYRITPKLGIGFGFVFATGSFSLRKAIPLQNKDGEYGNASLSGDAKGKGFNAGIFYKLNKQFSLGFNYRSKVKASIDEGTANFTVPASVAEFFPNTSFTTGLSLPSVSTLGIGYTMTDKIQLAFDLNYIGWSAYDSLIIDFKDNTDKLDDVRSPRQYKNTFIVRTGINYALNKIIQIRTGFYYDLSPVQDGYLSPETPDSDKLGLSCGLSINPAKWLSLDAAFLYTKGQSRTDTNLETQFEANYKTSSWIPCIGIRINF